MSCRSSTIGMLAAVATLCLGAAACSSATDANAQLKKAGVDISANGKGLPASFPKSDIPVPGLKLSSGAGLPDGSFALRFVSADEQKDNDDYKAALKAAGFAISNETSNPAQAALPPSVNFEATSAKWLVTVATFGKGQADGNYMAVVAMPAK